MKNSSLISCYFILVLSVIITLIIPFLFSAFMPQIYQKGFYNIYLFDLYPMMYVALLFLILCIMSYKHPFIIINNAKESDDNKFWIFVSISLILSIWFVRIIYFISVSSSPYILLHVDFENSYFGKYFSSLIIMFFNYLNFNLYPFFITLIIIGLHKINKKSLFILFILEFFYSISIGSKAIILYLIISLSIYFHKEIKKIILLYFVAFIVVITKPFFNIIRDYHLGHEINFSMSFVDYFVNIIQRIQTFIPIMYYNQKVDLYLNGMSFFKIIAYIIPDKLISLPYYAKNKDEDIFLTNLLDKVFFSYRLDDDLFNFYSEPYANFGLLGILFILLYVYLWQSLLKLSSQSINVFLPFYSFFFCNFLLRPHVGFSSIIAYSMMVFFISWFLLRAEKIFRI